MFVLFWSPSIFPKLLFPLFIEFIPLTNDTDGVRHKALHSYFQGTPILLGTWAPLSHTLKGGDNQVLSYYSSLQQKRALFAHQHLKAIVNSDCDLGKWQVTCNTWLGKMKSPLSIVISLWKKAARFLNLQPWNSALSSGLRKETLLQLLSESKLIL